MLVCLKILQTNVSENRADIIVAKNYIHVNDARHIIINCHWICFYVWTFRNINIYCLRMFYIKFNCTSLTYGKWVLSLKASKLCNKNEWVFSFRGIKFDTLILNCHARRLMIEFWSLRYSIVIFYFLSRTQVCQLINMFHSFW